MLLTEIFKSYRERLFRFIRARVHIPEDAEDILQETFYQLARMSSMALPVEQTTAWLYRVARNKIIDRSRKKKNEPLPAAFDDEDEDDYVFEDITDIVHGEAATPETEYLRSLILAEIAAALEELPKEQRDVFEWTEFDNMSVKEAAAEAGVPVNTALSRKHYAVRHLRKRLKDLYADVVGVTCP